MTVSRPLFKKRQDGRYFVGDFGPRQYIHVYAIHPRGGGNVKFGQAMNVKSRFSCIQVGSPVKLELIGSIFVPLDTEPAIHAHLADYRSHGEWFLPTMETLTIAEMIKCGDGFGLLSRIGLSGLLPDHVRDRINFADNMQAPPVRASPQMLTHADLLRGYNKPEVIQPK